MSSDKNENKKIVREITASLAPETRRRIGVEIDKSKKIKSRAKFAREVLGILPETLYKKIKGLRGFTYRELRIIEEFLEVDLDYRNEYRKYCEKLRASKKDL